MAITGHLFNGFKEQNCYLIAQVIQLVQNSYLTYTGFIPM